MKITTALLAKHFQLILDWKSVKEDTLAFYKIFRIPGKMEYLIAKITSKATDFRFMAYGMFVTAYETPTVEQLDSLIKDALKRNYDDRDKK